MQNPFMEANINNVESTLPRLNAASKESFKHFTVRLPSAPYFSGVQDESSGLTRLRSMAELLTGSRFTIHALICEVIDNVPVHGFQLPFPKLFSIPARTSMERIDLRLTQRQIDILDELRANLKGPAGIVDIREYYNRTDAVREILRLETIRVDALFRSWCSIQTGVSGSPTTG